MLNWRQEIVIICLAVMEVCWLRPLLVFLAQGRADDALPPLAILVLPLLVYWLSRVVIASRLPLVWVRVSILGGVFLAILGAIWFWRYDAYFPLDPAWIARLLTNLSQSLRNLGQPDLIAVLAGVYLSWRGIMMTRTDQLFSRVFDAFRVGVVMLLLVGLAQSLNAWQLQVVPYAFEFFLFGLTAIAVGRLTEIDARGQLRLQGERFWIAILAATIALVLGLGLASAALFGVDLGGVLLAVLGPVGWVFQVLVYLVLVILGYLAQLVVLLIRVVFPPMPIGSQINSAISMPQVPETPVVVEPYTLPPAIQLGVKLILGVGLALLLVFILARAIQRWRRAAQAGGGEVHESLLSAAVLGDDLSSWLRNLWNNLNNRLRRPEALPLPDENDPLYASFAIRRIYAELLAVAATVGLARSPGQTPYEYLVLLRLALPQHTGDANDLTTVYARARYDARRTTHAELETARAAWDRFRHDLQHLPSPEEPSAGPQYTRDVDEMTAMLVKGRPGA